MLKRCLFVALILSVCCLAAFAQDRPANVPATAIRLMPDPHFPQMQVSFVGAGAADVDRLNQNDAAISTQA